MQGRPVLAHTWKNYFLVSIWYFLYHTTCSIKVEGDRCLVGCSAKKLSPASVCKWTEKGSIWRSWRWPFDGAWLLLSLITFWVGMSSRITSLSKLWPPLQLKRIFFQNNLMRLWLTLPAMISSYKCIFLHGVVNVSDNSFVSLSSSQFCWSKLLLIFMVCNCAKAYLFKRFFFFVHWLWLVLCVFLRNCRWTCSHQRCILLTDTQKKDEFFLLLTYLNMLVFESKWTAEILFQKFMTKYISPWRSEFFLAMFRRDFFPLLCCYIALSVVSSFSVFISFCESLSFSIFTLWTTFFCLSHSLWTITVLFHTLCLNLWLSASIIL